jgi:hypothetical protein
MTETDRKMMWKLEMCVLVMKGPSLNLQVIGDSHYESANN